MTLIPVSAASINREATLRRVERRQWWLSVSSIFVTLLLTLGILSFAAPMLFSGTGPANTTIEVRALVALVLLFDIYVIFQQLQIYRFRVRLSEREELFRLIDENAADMIALIDAGGQRLYSSPSYQKLLGYSAAELASTSFYDQIHPEDKEVRSEERRVGK